MCPDCKTVNAVEETAEGNLRCLNLKCGAVITLCKNRVDHQACNRGVLAHLEESELCDYCDLNDVIPDLSVPGNLAKWQALELAKHRVLYVVKKLGLPIVGPQDEGEPKLVFDFKADGKHPVSTGHAAGRITINIVEADSAAREKTRVQFAEPQRTLVGHFRHELGHYYWELLVLPNEEVLRRCRELFGDERSPTYAEAQKRYYAEGPASNWRENVVSAYASMHPWEDFAETFNVYLDLVTVLITTNHFGWTKQSFDDFSAMLETYKSVGIVANEMNRDMGLLDLVPEIFIDAVVKKLEFVHELRKMPVANQPVAKQPVAK